MFSYFAVIKVILTRLTFNLVHGPELLELQFFENRRFACKLIYFKSYALLELEKNLLLI